MMPLRKGRFVAMLAASASLLAFVVVVSPGIGSTGDVGVLDAWRAWWTGDTDSFAYRAGFTLRLPGTLLAIQAGITLSLCGAVFQVLFRNPLATPYTLGISSGGALGALLAIRLGVTASLLGVSAVSVCAFGGAMLIVALVFLFTRGTRRLGSAELLLAGVTLGMFCSAMMMLVTYLSDVRQTFAIVRWMMGSLQSVGAGPTTPGWLLLAPSWMVLLYHARALNQYLAGDELAASRGVNVARLQAMSILFASLAVAAVVAVCGPIGFVGLVVPQMTALVVGRDCRILLPASALMGGVFLALCHWMSDLAPRWAGALLGRDISSASLPIGVVTAVVGVPIFLVLLHRRAR